MEKKITPCFACKHMYSDDNLEPCKSCINAAEKSLLKRRESEAHAGSGDEKMQSQGVSSEK